MRRATRALDYQTAFTTFDEAFVGATCAVSHAHRYTIADSYPVALLVRDDGGVGIGSALARIVTPEQAVEQILFGYSDFNILASALYLLLSN